MLSMHRDASVVAAAALYSFTTYVPLDATSITIFAYQN
jgi:hypothetical protein